MDSSGDIYELSDEQKKILSGEEVIDISNEEIIETKEDVARLDGFLRGRAEGSKSRRHEKLVHDSSGGKTYRKESGVAPRQLDISNEINRSILGEYMGIEGIQHLTGDDIDAETLADIRAGISEGDDRADFGTIPDSFECNPDETLGMGDPGDENDGLEYDLDDEPDGDVDPDGEDAPPTTPEPGPGTDPTPLIGEPGPTSPPPDPPRTLPPDDPGEQGDPGPVGEPEATGEN